jgi:hypothetical protein
MTDHGTEPRTTQSGVQKFIGQLLNFDELIGGSLLRVLYYLGLAGIVLWSLVALVGALAMARYSAEAFLVGLLTAVAILVFGTVFWRFTCELWMVIFKIHDRLGEIRDRLEPRP